MFDEKIDGLDLDKGIARFGSKEVFRNILISYVKSIKPIVETLKEMTSNILKENHPDPDEMEKYALAIHSLRGATYGIFAVQAGDKADSLEIAANNGDIGFVKENSRDFIDMLSALIAGIENAIEKNKDKEKPVKEKIDEDILNDFLTACYSLDIDEMDAAMGKIEEFMYKNDNELAVWLREKLDQGKYGEITGKLEARNGKHQV